MFGSVRIQTSAVSRTDLEPASIQPGKVIAGSPVARSIRMSVSADGDLSSFVWDCTAGQFQCDFTVDEIVHILDGEVSIAGADGQTVILRTGDTAYFPHGTSTIWDVPNYVRKFAMTRIPATDPLSRGVRRLKQVTRPLRRWLRQLAPRA